MEQMTFCHMKPLCMGKVKWYIGLHILYYVSYVNCKGSIVLNDHVSGRTIGATELNVYLDCYNIKLGFFCFRSYLFPVNLHSKQTVARKPG